MRRFVLPLLLLPLILLSACSDDDNDGVSASPTPAAIATSSSDAPNPTGAAADVAIEGTVSVDFTGAPQELEAIEAPFEVAPGSSAWDAVLMALGEDKVSSQDFGGDLGIFVSGFNGVDAEGNHFWEFKVNGETAQEGVGKYEVQQGDVIEFVYSSF